MKYIRAFFLKALIFLLVIALFTACTQRSEQSAQTHSSDDTETVAGNNRSEESSPSVIEPEAPPAPLTTSPPAAVTRAPATAILEQPMMVEAPGPDYKIGQILYNPPAEMTLNVTETVEIRIGKDEISTEGLVGSGQVQQDTLPISRIMSVKLCCGDSATGDPFDIHSAASEEQLIDSSRTGKNYSEWVFQVTPRRKGQHQLQLIVSAYYTLSGGKTVRKDEVLKREIDVKVNTAQEAKNWLIRYWQWLGLLLVIPLAAFIMSHRNRSGKKHPILSGDEAIFISYRRDDSSGYTLAIYEKLKAALGDEHVFMDLDDIPHGVNFAKHLEKVLSTASTVLVMIGTGWLNASNAQGRRLDQEGDYVRMEIAAALAKEGLRVIPVLLKGADMPGQDALPDELKELAMRNAIRIHDDQFDASIQRLIDSIAQ